MDTKHFSAEMWADVAEVIFQGIELSEYEQILRDEEESALRESPYMVIPSSATEDFIAMFFNRYEGMKHQIQGRPEVVNSFAILLKTAITCSGDPGVASAFREQMMKYIPHRNEVFQKAARTLIGDYMEPD